MNARQLANSLDEMMKETKRGHLSWSMQIETTDDLDASKHYLELTNREIATVEAVTSKFSNVVVIINSANAMYV